MKKIIVIKIGSSVLMTKRSELDEFRIISIAKQIKSLKEKGLGVVLVISGAVSLGSKFIDLTNSSSVEKQAAAGIGQIYLSSVFNKIFSFARIQIAQILVTKEFLKEKVQMEKIANLVNFYLELGFIPFFNENDVLDLNSFKGNDFLAADLTNILNAEKLIILSTMEGSKYAVGGGKAKRKAINIVSKNNISSTIANGKSKNILTQILL